MAMIFGGCRVLVFLTSTPLQHYHNANIRSGFGLDAERVVWWGEGRDPVVCFVVDLKYNSYYPASI